MERLEQKKIFIRKLAAFLVDNQAGKGIMLELEQRGQVPPPVPFAREWAELRQASPIFGYPTIDEAERMLMEFLG